MKKSILFNVLIVILLIFAFFPAKEAHATPYYITGTLTIDVDTTIDRDWVVTSGGSLTIASGVTLTVNCSDADPYTLGNDATKIEIIVEEGVLIADGATFQGAVAASSCWYGIEVWDEGDANLTNNTIRDAVRGITVSDASPLISGNTITQIHGVDSAMIPTRTAYGILVYGAGSEPVIAENVISQVHGGNGCTVGVCTDRDGSDAYGIFAADSLNAVITENRITSIYGGDGVNGVAGTAGGNGANGTDSHPGGYAGGTGGTGEDGGDGGDAYGMMIHTLTAEVSDNIINNIYGGDAGSGGLGGTGGHGGVGYTWTAPVSEAPAEGGFGGAGGIGGTAGLGGNGGNGYGMFLWNSDLEVKGNTVSFVRPGAGRTGGSGGFGGNGGQAGQGSPVTATVYYAGYGGSGGAGGNGRNGGSAGSSGDTYGIYIEATYLSVFNENSITDIISVAGASGSSGGTGGPGGKGGNGGSNTYTTDPSYHGGGGGDGNVGGTGGTGGHGGESGAVFGLYVHNTSVETISRTLIERTTGSVAGKGGRSGQGGSGGQGGLASSNNPDARGGNGGNGGSSGIGGTGGTGGDVMGMQISNTETLVLNTLINSVEAKMGGAGGDGYTGGNGGNGNNGYTQPGGKGGNGGNSGNGGTGGQSGWAWGIKLVNPLADGIEINMTNNTIVDIIAPYNTVSAGGIAGTTVGTGGTGGAGTPAGAVGSPGVLGSAGISGAVGRAYGVLAGKSVLASLTNSIVATYEGKTGNNTGVDADGDGEVEMHYNTVYNWDEDLGGGIVPDSHISYADPRFIDHVTEEDLHLASTSPCIDTGTNKADTTLWIDLDGTPRPLDGDGDGDEVIDRGAYEYGVFFEFTQVTKSVNEDGTTVSVTVSQIGYWNEIKTVEYYSDSITATEPSDYAGFTSGTIGYPSGTGGSEIISILIIDDALAEGNETFAVKLRNPYNGLLGDPIVLTITIVDNDMLLTFLPLIIR